jgi:protease II
MQAPAPFISRHILAAGLTLCAPFPLICQSRQSEPPVARSVPRADTLHGDVRTDSYFWLRDDRRSAPEVIAYLNAENRYTKAVMRHTEPLQRRIYQEMVGRIKETTRERLVIAVDASIPLTTQEREQWGNPSDPRVGAFVVDQVQTSRP